jgi:hypothetical protein
MKERRKEERRKEATPVREERRKEERRTITRAQFEYLAKQVSKKGREGYFTV